MVGGGILGYDFIEFPKNCMNIWFLRGGEPLDPPITSLELVLLYQNKCLILLLLFIAVTNTDIISSSNETRKFRTKLVPIDNKAGTHIFGNYYRYYFNFFHIEKV